MRRTVVVGVGLGLLLAIPSTGLGACGDGILDPGEECETVGPWRCCSGTCQRLDADNDGVCDDEDVCRQSPEARLTEITLRMSRIATPPGDERMRLTGHYQIRPEALVDPATEGLRIDLHAEVSTVMATVFTPMITARIPGGPGWSGGNTSWRFRDPKGRYAGITSIALKLLVPTPVPGDTTTTLAFTITARRSGFVVTPDMVALYDVGNPGPWGQLALQMALGTTGDGFATCAQTYRPSYTTLPTVPCTLTAHGNTLTCGSPPPVGPCRVGEPRVVTRCEIMAVASAEEAYRAAHGTYFSGSCPEVPGYTPTPNAYMSCALAASTTELSIAIANAAAPGYFCSYASSATPPLSCN